MIAYQTKFSKLAGTSYKEVYKKAQEVFGSIKRRTKRKPYIKSVYFGRQKVFFDYYWIHLARSGGYKERVKRLKYFRAALDLLRYCRNHPTSKENPNKKSEILHRFAGLTREKEIFYVQVKENKRTGRKYFMSCFPPE
ncbi:hypothetical protein ACFLZP_01010 [Patescibacteria group bacterium]